MLMLAVPTLMGVITVYVIVATLETGYLVQVQMTLCCEANSVSKVVNTMRERE